MRIGQPYQKITTKKQPEIRPNKQNFENNEQTTNKKLKIGNVTLEVPTIVAPMEAVNCEAFMKTCAELGAGMVSTQAIEHKEDNFYNLDVLKKIKTPTSFQIMTAKPDVALQLAKEVEGSVDVIDFNFGCPLKHILGKKAGGYLLQFPHLIEKIVKPVIEEVKTPITVKIRKGFDQKRIKFSEIGKLADDIGVSAITLHGRTVRQKYTDKADLRAIERLHTNSKIPVIANGDISKVGHVKSILEKDIADGVMIGRAAKNNPRLFLEIKNNLLDEKTPIPTRLELLELFYKYYQEQERQNLHQVQDHAAWFLAGHQHADVLREQVRTTTSVDEILTIYEQHCQD